jgi:hypothetical protein
MTKGIIRNIATGKFWGAPGRGTRLELSEAHIYDDRALPQHLADELEYGTIEFIALIPLPAPVDAAPVGTNAALDKVWADASPAEAFDMLTKGESRKRKSTPVWAGVLRYFPDAICAVARLSKAGNDKHNPGEPLHWARDKSTDQEDCVVRHMLTPELMDDETGELHAVAAAWRALATLQLLEEQRLGTEAISVQLAVHKAAA